MPVATEQFTISTCVVWTNYAVVEKSKTLITSWSKGRYCWRWV